MGQEIEQLARFTAETQPEDIPAPVRQHAKLVLLDTFGVILAGSERPEVAELRARLAPGAGGGATVYARGLPAHDPRTAALLNGIAGRAIELCEGLRLVSGQAAMQTLPAALAVAEAAGRNGRDLLTALVLAYEVAGRLCSAFTPRPLAHQNGQASLLAAAAAGARLRGCDAEATSLAMRIATTMLMTPSYTNTVTGATALNVPGGLSGFAGALAPDLVLAGFHAQPDAIEEALGKLAGDGFRTEGLTRELGTRWSITENYFRLYACCNPIHPALDALEHVLRELKPAPGDVEAIDVATYRFASVMQNPQPPNFFGSKYSLPHAAAVMVVRGRASHRELDDSALDDPAVAALRPRVHVSEDAQMSAVAPRLRPARVTVKLKDGRSVSHSVESHRGDFKDPFGEDEIRAKFAGLAGEVLTPQGVDDVAQAIDACEDWSSVREFVALVRGAAQSA